MVATRCSTNLTAQPCFHSNIYDLRSWKITVK